MPLPACHCADQAYAEGMRDGAALSPSPELARQVAALLQPLLQAMLDAMSVRSAEARRMLTVAQAAAQLGVSTRQVYDWLYKGAIPSMQVPSTTGRMSLRRIEQAELDAFVERHRVACAATPGAAPGPRTA